MKQTKKNQNRTQKKQNPIQTPPRKNEKRAKKKTNKSKTKSKQKHTPNTFICGCFFFAFSSLFFRFFLDIFLQFRMSWSSGHLPKKKRKNKMQKKSGTTTKKRWKKRRKTEQKKKRKKSKRIKLYIRFDFFCSLFSLLFQNGRVLSSALAFAFLGIFFLRSRLQAFHKSI